MQISIETTTQSASLFTASFSNGGAEGQKNDPKGNAYGHEIGQRNGHDKSPAVNALEAASKQAEEDAVVIAALQDAVEKAKARTTTRKRTARWRPSRTIRRPPAN